MLVTQQRMHLRSRLSLLLLLLVLGLGSLCRASAQPDPHLRKLFAALDKDHDGQLIKSELLSYIKNTDSSYSSSTKLDQAVERAIGRLDSPDVGLGVSWTELQQHLHTLLQDVKVADWVAHGLGLPQYAEAFTSNSITALDLPMLVNDGGKLLQSELKVESPLHRQQLLRAMQRQILGLGSPPGPLQHLQCSVSISSSSTGSSQAQHADADAMPAPADAASNTQQSADADTAADMPGATATAAAAVPAAVVCSWLPPADAGQPGMHKYVLQRMDHSAPSAVWQTVAELHDSLSVRHTDVPSKPGVYQYRLTAWNVYGRSPYILSYDVAVPNQHATPAAATRASKAGGTAGTAAGTVLAGIQTVGTAATGTAAQQQQQQQQASSCGSSSTGDLCWPDGLVVSYHQQQLQDQQLYPQHAASCGGEGLVSGCDPSNESQQECANSFGQQFSSGKGYAPSQQSPNGGVVWLVGLNPDQPWTQGTPATAAGRVAQQRLAESLHAAAAVGAKRGIAASTGGPAGAGPATSSNESSKGSATTARLVALLGSAWHSSMNSWLKAVANTLTAFLLLVLPICVRLLPVHVLTQAAQMLAWGLHFLPAPLRQGLLLRQEPVAGQQPLGASVQQQEQQVGAASALLREVDGSSGGSRAGTPQRRRATDGTLYQQPTHPAAPGVSVVGAAGDVTDPAASHSPVVTAASPAASLGAAGGGVGAAAAAAAGARRRLLPRSVSDFDLVRQARSASPSAASRPQARAVSSSLSSSPVCGGGSAGGLLGASAVRFASGSGSSAAGYGQLVAPSTAAVQAGQGQQGAASDAPQPGYAATAAAVVGIVDEEVERELQYLLGAGHGSTLPDNKQCSFPGCRQQFGLRHWKATLQRHYCGRCQQAFCAQHTAYSPHGSSGTCGVQSRCLCIDCFYEYTPEYQAFLASRNTLTGKRSRSGPPVAAAAMAAGSSSSSTGGSKTGGMLSRLVPHSLSSSQKQLAFAASNGGSGSAVDAPKPADDQPQQHQGQEAADGASAYHVQQPTAASAGSVGDMAGQQTTKQQAAGVQQHARRSTLSAGASAPSAAYSRGTKSRMLWGRGLTKALGVVRFKHAGDMHAGAASQPETAAAAAAAAAARSAACAAAGAAGQEA